MLTISPLPIGLPSKLQTHVTTSQVTQTLCSRFNLGSVPAVIRSAKLVNDGQAHEVVIIREDNKGSVQVDGGPIVPGFTKGEGEKMKVRRTPIFLAGAPSNSLYLPSQATLYKTAFKGCILEMKVWNNKVKQILIFPSLNFSRLIFSFPSLRLWMMILV